MAGGQSRDPHILRLSVLQAGRAWIPDSLLDSHLPFLCLMEHWSACAIPYPVHTLQCQPAALPSCAAPSCRPAVSTHSPPSCSVHPQPPPCSVHPQPPPCSVHPQPPSLSRPCSVYPQHPSLQCSPAALLPAQALQCPPAAADLAAVY